MVIENMLTVSAEILNTGNKILPFSYGAHPAFALEGSIKNYSVLKFVFNYLFYIRLCNVEFSTKIATN